MADVTKGMAGKFWPGGAGEEEGIDPGAEVVAWEGAEEAFFCAVSVGDNGSVGEAGLDVWPEQHELWRMAQVFLRDAVDFMSRPGDGLVGVDV